MRLDRPQDRVYARAAGVLAVLAGTGLGALLAGAQGAIWGAVLGLALARVLAHLVGRRIAHRRAALDRPFPEAWRKLLEARYDHYARLPEALRGRFQDDVRILLAEKRITGVELEVTDELRVLVAASAVTLSLGWPDYDWDQLAEVLLYPDSFDRDYRFGGDEYAGLTHPWGTVILSVPALEKSFQHPDDGYHVGIHEFAHLLDMDHTHFDGIPVGLDAVRSREWVALMDKEMERLRHRKSALDPYGADDPIEFLAVAVEAFFEIPLLMRKRHREVYAILSAYFGQDPAVWDDERGLVL